MRYLLSWFLLALASSVHAEWMPIRLFVPDDSGQTYFVERESLLRESGFVTFVSLIDYTTPQQSGSTPPQAYSGSGGFEVELADVRANGRLSRVLCTRQAQ